MVSWVKTYICKYILLNKLEHILKAILTSVLIILQNMFLCLTHLDKWQQNVMEYWSLIYSRKISVFEALNSVELQLISCCDWLQAWVLPPLYGYKQSEQTYKLCFDFLFTILTVCRQKLASHSFTKPSKKMWYLYACASFIQTKLAAILVQQTGF